MLNSQNQLICFASQKRHGQKNYKFPQFFAKLSLKTIWLNIPRYKSFKLCNDFQNGYPDVCDICEYFKGKKPEKIHPLNVMGKIY